MLEVQIQRVACRDPGQLGRLAVLDVATGKTTFACRTLELDWADNIKDHSCIPAGDYSIVARAAGRFYARYKKLWGHKFGLHVTPVEGRDLILIHRGNRASGFEQPATRGCLLVGLAAGEDRNEDGETCNVLYQSTPAYRGLYRALYPTLSQGLPVALSIVGGEEADEDLSRDRRDL